MVEKGSQVLGAHVPGVDLWAFNNSSTDCSPACALVAFSEHGCYLRLWPQLRMDGLLPFALSSDTSLPCLQFLELVGSQ